MYERGQTTFMILKLRLSKRPALNYIFACRRIADTAVPSVGCTRLRLTQIGSRALLITKDRYVIFARDALDH